MLSQLRPGVSPVAVTAASLVVTSALAAAGPAVTSAPASRERNSATAMRDRLATIIPFVGVDGSGAEITAPVWETSRQATGNMTGNFQRFRPLLAARWGSAAVAGRSGGVRLPGEAAAYRGTPAELQRISPALPPGYRRRGFGGRHAARSAATHASWVADSHGVMTATRRLGHANASVTTRHYARPIDGRDAQVAKHLDKLGTKRASGMQRARKPRKSES
jgi:hypothetical protein